jgi:Meiotically up-regulated gene 113
MIAPIDGDAEPRPNPATGAVTNPELKKRMSGIYLLGEEGGPFVKIGMSRNVKDRTSTLQTASPRDLRVLGIVPGGRNEEAALHYAFADLHVRNEWYRDDGRIAVWFTSRALAIATAEHEGQDTRRLAAVKLDAATDRKAARQPTRNRAPRPVRTTPLCPPTPGSPRARLLGMLQDGQGVVRGCQAEIGRAVGISRTRVRQLLGDLAAAGMIRVRTSPTGTVISLTAPKGRGNGLH